MKLTELKPKWVGINGVEHGETTNIRFGLSFLCPCCREKRVAVFFKPSIDPGNWAWKVQWRLPEPTNRFWDRTGETFETITLTPSVGFDGSGHWHGHITSGEVTP